MSSEDESTQDSVRSKPSPRKSPASNRRSTITPASKQVIEDIIEETTSDTSEIQVTRFSTHFKASSFKWLSIISYLHPKLTKF